MKPLTNLIRRRLSFHAVSTCALTLTCKRYYHLPGWKTKTCTKDARTHQQREADRKLRQLEKLPPVEALHDFQYPYEKTILNDYMFQYPLFENDLDTPHLYHLTPPPNFFLYWNVSDFERTAYPSVPETDHRLLKPSSKSTQWQEHQSRMSRYWEKHQITPHYVPRVLSDANLSVVFPGEFRTKSRKSSEPLPPPETSLTRRNFWFTAHCGNYIELSDLQLMPSIFIQPCSEMQTSEVYYTLVMVSPDYPYRLPPYDTANHHRHFFLHTMITNIRVLAESPEAPSPVFGDVLVPYVPPLPTEDGGSTRHFCLLYRQSKKCELSEPPSDWEQWEKEYFPLSARSNFQLHEPRGDNAGLSRIEASEKVLDCTPSALTFFQTKWDIQVQEYYEKINHPEPALPVDETIEALLEFHAAKPDAFRIRSRHRPDGSTNIGDDPQFWGQQVPTRIMQGSMQSLWSRRTAMGANGVPVIYPR